MIQLFVDVRYKNGRKKRKKFKCQDTPTSGAECRLPLTSVLRNLVPGWGLVAENCECYDKVMCHTFSLHEIVKILVQIKVSRSLCLTKQPRNLLTVSKWKYTGRFFDLDSVTYGSPRLPREFSWDQKELVSALVQGKCF